MHKIFAALLVVSILALPAYAQDVAPIADAALTEYLPIAATVGAFLAIAALLWGIVKALQYVSVSVPAETVQQITDALLTASAKQLEAAQAIASRTKTPYDDMALDVLVQLIQKKGYTILVKDEGKAEAQSAGE